MVATREASVLWVLVVVVACGGRSVRHGPERGIALVTGGTGGTAPLGIGGMLLAVGGSAPAEAAAGTAGTAGTAGVGGTAGVAGTGGTTGTPDEPSERPENEPCDPNADPLDPTSGPACPGEPPLTGDCDELAHAYELAVGIAQWCEVNADCHAGVPVPQTLHCGCDVIVTTVAELAPIAAEWRALGCALDAPCTPSAACAPTEPPYVCGEAQFCLDDR